MRAPVVDVHAHLLGVDRDGHGCLLSPAMWRRISTRAVLARIGARRRDGPAAIDRRFLDHLHAQLDGAPSVGTVVLLAMDGVYREDGTLDEARTHLMVPNDYAREVAAGHPKLRFGASVNPARRDALAELDRCAAAGAALVKWLPAAQGFDPASPRFAPFYRRLVDLGMPLLSHVGAEHAVASTDERFGELGRLRPAAEAGVRLVVPHAGGLKVFRDAGDWEEFRAFVLSRPTVFLDESALCMVHRRRRLVRLLGTPDLHGRVLHGSDFPLPVQAWAFADRVGLRAARRIGRIPSAFEQDLALKRALGAPEEWFTRASGLLRRPVGIAGVPRGGRRG